MADQQRTGPATRGRGLIQCVASQDRNRNFASRHRSRSNPENVVKLGSHLGNLGQQARERNLDGSGLARTRSFGIPKGRGSQASQQSEPVSAKRKSPPVCSNSEQQKKTTPGSLNHVKQNYKSEKSNGQGPGLWKLEIKSNSTDGPHLKNALGKTTGQIAKRNETKGTDKQTNNKAIQKVSADKQVKRDSKTKIPVLHNSTLPHQYDEQEVPGVSSHSDKSQPRLRNSPTQSECSKSSLGAKRCEKRVAVEETRRPPCHSDQLSKGATVRRKFPNQSNKSSVGVTGKPPSHSDKSSVEVTGKPQSHSDKSSMGVRGKSPSYSDKSLGSDEKRGSVTSVDSVGRREGHRLREDCLEIKLSSSHSLQRKSSSTRSLRTHSGSSRGGSRQLLASSAQRKLQEKRGPAQGTEPTTEKNDDENPSTPSKSDTVPPRLTERSFLPAESKALPVGVSGCGSSSPVMSQRDDTKKCTCLLSRTLGKNNQNSRNMLVSDPTTCDFVGCGLPDHKGDIPVELRPGKVGECEGGKHTKSSQIWPWSAREADDVLEEYAEPDHSNSPQTLLDNEDLSKLANHALKVTPKDATSFDSLLSYLCVDLESDLSRVRAIFCWIVSQRLPVIDDVRDIPPQDSPLGSLYLITQGKMSYSQVFCKMCRCVDIPCVVINGISKGVTYHVGDVMSREKHCNSWNAVYLEKTWRLVHCHWASRSARGYNSGNWVTVDCPEFRSNNVKGESRSYIVSSLINDYYFFTDPAIFIHKCFPFDERWQLLSKKITKEEFETCPFLQPAFFALNLGLVDKTLSCVIYTQENFVLQIRMPHGAVERLRFSYNLYRLRNSWDEGEYDYPSLERFTLHYCVRDVAFFEVRFPPLSNGDYKLQVFCSDDQICLPSEWICDFRIVCEKGMDVSIPLPVVPWIGWGRNPELAKHGITAVSHTDGYYSLDNDLIIFEFVFPAEAESHAELLKHKCSRSEYADYVKVERDGVNVCVKAEAPCSGEFALQIFCQQEGGLGYVNVMNYLLKRSVFAESRACSAIRRNLASALSRSEATVEELSDILEEFLRSGAEDQGEVEEARKRLRQLQLRRDLQAAITCRSLDKLEKALQEVKSSHQASAVNIGDYVSKGEKLLTHLRRLRRLKMAVLEMDSQTIAELRSYIKPPLAVHGVMVATYVLLGVDEKELRHWCGIQSLIGRTGKESLKRRVASFDVKKVRAETLHRAQELLSLYDLTIVQEASAGAATFYLWAINMIKDIEEQNPS